MGWVVTSLIQHRHKNVLHAFGFSGKSTLLILLICLISLISNRGFSWYYRNQNGDIPMKNVLCKIISWNKGKQNVKIKK